MGLLGEKKQNNAHSENQATSTIIQDAEARCISAGQETQKALLALGNRVFDAEKDDSSSAYLAEIAIVKECMENEKLHELYRLSLEGKTKCDSCGAIITADSIFCNKCAAKVPERDFSVIGVVSKPQIKTQEIKTNACPQCGSTLSEGAAFCEKCGTKILSSTVMHESSFDSNNSKACPYCGATLTDGAAFCEKCGKRIS